METLVFEVGSTKLSICEMILMSIKDAISWLSHPIAKSSPAMWTPIFKQNKKLVVRSLKEYISNLTMFKNLLENENYEAVFNEMQNTNRIKEILDNS